MVRSLHLILALLFFSPLLHAADAVEVTATVDRNQVGLGDVVNLTVNVDAKQSVQVNEPRLKNLDGFELINSSSGTETRSLFQNGRFVTEQSRNFTYMLAVNKKGNLTIPPLEVEVDGKTYQTKSITIAANGERSKPSQQAQRRQGQAQDPFEEMDQMEEMFNQMLQKRMAPNAFGGAPGAGGGGGNVPQNVNPDEAFFVQADVDKKKVYVGEQVVANFYLYTRGQIRDIDTLKYPDLKGFWKEDLEMATRLNFEQAVINGIAYQRALLVSYALFPIRPGKTIVDPYKAKCTVLTPSAFGFGHPYVFTKASKPIAIEVEDVPTANRPANFTGAVGNFRLTAQFEPTTGSTNQPVTLRVRVEGRGNAKLIELPKLNLPDSFELYDQKSSAKFLKDGTSFKEFEVLLIPRQPGIFKIPPVEIAAFDPQAKKFDQVHSAPLELSVTGSATAPEAPMQAAAKPATPGEDKNSLPPLSTELAATPSSGKTGLLFAGFAFLAAFGFLTQQSLSRFREQSKSVSLSLILSTRLSHVREHVAKKEWRRVGVELTNAAYAILGQLSEQGGASQDVGKLLEFTAPSVRNELAVPIQKILAQCEALSFAPESMIGEMTEKGKMSALIAEFEKVMKRAIELSET